MEEFSILSKTVVLCFILHAIPYILIVGVRCQANTNDEFISIDCGFEGEDYEDTDTGLTYTSDARFIDRGVTHQLSKEYSPRQLATLRSFPDDTRVCYAFPGLVQNAKYLIRASFMYGDYDGLNRTPILFDLHLGVNLWKEMNITSPSDYYTAEVLTAVSESHLLTVCLVAKSSAGTPTPLFISALELRRLETAMYPAVNVSNPPLVLNSRKNMGASAPVVRYPDDKFDRIWESFNYPREYWTRISTNSSVGVSPDDHYRAPPKVLQTAVVPADNGTELNLVWDAAVDAADGNIVSQYHVFIYFAELSSSGTRRTFNIYLGDSFLYGPFTPQHLLADVIYTTHVWTRKEFSLSIRQDNTSMSPPILNALETYTLMSLSNVPPTDATDVDAIMKIKEQYQLKRNWMGDPCAPKVYSWHGLDCNYDASPRIIALNLSSSGLTGDLADSFGDLREITNLDLSDNKLTGTIPEFLANIPSLKVLNLSGNYLTGSVPFALLSRSANRSLLLRCSSREVSGVQFSSTTLGQ